MQCNVHVSADPINDQLQSMAGGNDRTSTCTLARQLELHFTQFHRVVVMASTGPLNKPRLHPHRVV